MEKDFWKSKTFWFNLLALVVSVAAIFGYAEYQPGAEAQQTIDAVTAFVVAGVPLVNILLRFVTANPLKKLW